MTKLLLKLITGVFLSGLAFCFAGCANKKSGLDYQTFKAQNGWGYNILMKGRTVIHQDIVPTLNTNKGFETQEEATKAARLVISKIKLKKLPLLTSLEVQELISAQ